jgi:predicted permease
LGRIAVTLSPLALFSVGLQLRLRFETHHLSPLLMNFSWKLGIAPLLIFTLGWALHVSTPIVAVTVLQGAMAPMVTAGILCQQHDLDTPLANLLVGGGIMLSFLTVPLWNLAL